LDLWRGFSSEDQIGNLKSKIQNVMVWQRNH